MNPLPSPMAVHMVCECPLSVSCREREAWGWIMCKWHELSPTKGNSRFLLPIYFLSPKHFSHLHMIRPYIVFWKADCYLSIQFSMERKDRGTVLLVGNEITSVSRRLLMFSQGRNLSKWTAYIDNTMWYIFSKSILRQDIKNSYCLVGLKASVLFLYISVSILMNSLALIL